MTTTRDVRRPIPVGVKLQVALLALGYNKDEIAREIEYDHAPALGLRRWNDEARDYEPGQHDPEYIKIRLKSEHRRKTTGRKGESKLSGSDGDIQQIAKLKRVTNDESEFRRRLLAKDAGAARPPSKWPKRKLRSGKKFQRRASK